MNNLEQLKNTIYLEAKILNLIILIEFSNIQFSLTSMVNPEGVSTQEKGANLLFRIVFAGNCMKTRMHSSRIGTTHCNCFFPYHICPFPCTPPCHACPTTTHAPQAYTPVMQAPCQIHTHHACPHHTHTFLPCTPHHTCSTQNAPPAMHAPPHTPPLCMPHHTCPLPCIPPPCIPPVDRILDTHLWKYYLTTISLWAVILLTGRVPCT